jgi:hypothetical protein
MIGGRLPDHVDAKLKIICQTKWHTDRQLTPLCGTALWPLAGCEAVPF